MTAGSDIAAEIAAAYGEATAAVGDGPLIVTILRDGAITGPSYEPVKGPDTEHPLNALIGEYSTYERQSSLVEATDVKIDVAAGQGVEPTNADRVRFPNETKKHAIKRVEPFNIGGPALYYTLHLKG